MVSSFIIGFMIGGLLFALIVECFAMRSLRDAWASHTDSLREHNRFIVWVGKELWRVEKAKSEDEGGVEWHPKIPPEGEGEDIDEFFKDASPFPTEFAKWHSELPKGDV